MGFEALVTSYVKVQLAVFWVSEVGTKPDQKPLSIGAHGELKAAWAMEWFLGQKWNETVSPCAAVMESGLKTSSPVLVPTATLWSAARAEPARAVAAKMVVKCIVIGCGNKSLGSCGSEWDSWKVEIMV